MPSLVRVNYIFYLPSFEQNHFNFTEIPFNYLTLNELNYLHLYFSSGRGGKTLYDALLNESLWSDEGKMNSLRDILSRGKFNDGCTDLSKNPLRDVS